MFFSIIFKKGRIINFIILNLIKLSSVSIKISLMSKYNLDFDRLAITYPKKAVNNLLDEANTKSVFLFLFKLITST